MGGKDLWKASMKAQAQILEKNGDIHMAVCSLLSIEQPEQAVELLERSGLLKDAILLYKLTSNQNQDENPKLKKMFENLAIQSAASEEAAKAFLAIGEHEKAALAFLKSINFGNVTSDDVVDADVLWKDCEKCAQGICFLRKAFASKEMFAKEREKLFVSLEETWKRMVKNEKMTKELINSRLEIIATLICDNNENMEFLEKLKNHIDNNVANQSLKRKHDENRIENIVEEPENKKRKIE